MIRGEDEDRRAHVEEWEGQGNGEDWRGLERTEEDVSWKKKCQCFCAMIDL